MGIQINGNTDNISATDGGLSISDLEINQSGISTFNGNIDANGDLDVDGHTNLDNVSIAGIATVTGDFKVANAGNGRVEIETQTARTVFRGSSGVGIYGETGQNNNAVLSMHPTGSSVYTYMKFYNSSGNSYTSITGHDGGNLFIDSASNGSIYHRANGTGDHIWQNGGSETFRVGKDGDIGLSGTNYGTSGQVLTSGGSGSAATWSTVSGTTINNNADNRLITGSGTANTLEGESDLTYDGTNLSIPNGIIHTGDTNTAIRFPANDNISMESGGSEVFRITHDGAHGSTQSIQLRTTHTIDGAAVNMGGTKAYSGGIIRGMANIRDGNAYTVTDNGGGIGFSAIYNSGGSHTTMSQIEGVKANNTDGNYEGAIKFSTRHHNGNMIEKVRIGLNGISFEGQTADAHCLNDYEEGSWTPACNVGSVSVADGGTYVKIGKLVHLTVLLYNFSNTSSSSAILISGVPFNSSAQAVGTVWLRRTNVESLSYKCTIGDSANNIINISYDSNGNGNNMGGQLTYAKFAHSTPYMNVTLTYQTNS